ncbi:MAG: glutamate--tRNA ligase [Candidatus Woesearchaeota archaeon]
MEKELEVLVRKFALANAVHYNGKANFGSVLGRLLAERPEIKNELKTLSKEISAVVETVNRIPFEEQKAELERTAPELLEGRKKEEVRGLKELPNAEMGKVVMRIAPSPSGPLHIGHALVLNLNSEYCRKYNGMMILRIEDTNPENIYPPAYKMLEDEAQWLTKNNVRKVVIQSDRLHTYYDYAEKLVNMGKAYVCTCNPDVFRELVQRKKACPCRNLELKEQQLRWDKMFSGYEPGEAVLRIKTDINDPNPAMRDWPAMRINHHVHPRTGTTERVWPLMNFSVAIDDHELGMTHTIRGKDHKDNEKRQKHIFDAFGWKMPVHLYVGRINFEGFELSTSKTRQAIERGEYSGWDDVRLPFMAALRRRGYQPDAFIQFAVDVGLGENDKTVTIEEFFKTIDAHNRRILEPIANRYFFVCEPVEIRIAGAPKQVVELDLHPDHKERGKRKFETWESFFIAKDDLAALEDKKVYRLMECGNFTKEGATYKFHSRNVEDYREKGARIMHWLPVSNDLAKVEVLMPDGSKKTGLGEAGLKKLQEGAIIQFERFGFVRLDRKHGDKLVFCFAHK